MFEPVDASSTYEETIARLGIAIRIGILPPGSKLPPERELAEQLHISRSTLRQALATLTSSGHLNAVRGRLGGTFVSLDPPLTAGARFTRTRVPELLNWRGALEVGTTLLAAERADDEDRAHLAEVHELLEEAADVADSRVFRRADIAFHLVLAEMTGSTRLVSAVTRVHGELCEVLAKAEIPGGTRERVLADHRAVLDAVREGDPARAVAEMRGHLELTEHLLGAVTN